MRSMSSGRSARHAHVDPTAAPAPARPRSRVLRGAAHGALLLSLVGVTGAFAAAGGADDAAAGGFAGAMALATSTAADAPARTLTTLPRAASRGQERLALPRSVTIAVDGQERRVLTREDSVAEVLAEAGVVLGAADEVSVPLDASPADGATIAVARVTFAERLERTEIPFETTEQPDGSLVRGEREVVTAGVPGAETVAFRARLVDGVEVSRDETLRTLVQPVTEVVRVGTKAPAPAPAPRASGTYVPAPVYSGDARSIGRSMVAARGWGEEQWVCLDRLWTKESNWNPYAQNPSSGAYGIPQSLPGSKMATVAGDWRTNPATQITWGLNYIAGRYGTPCGAWAHSQARNWY